MVQNEKTKKKMSMKMRLLLASPFLIIALIMMARDGKEGYENADKIHNVTTPEWDVENMDAMKNGNIDRAIAKLNEIGDIREKAETVSLEQLNRRLWDYIGKPVKAEGYVVYANDYPSTHAISKMFNVQTSAEIQFATEELLFCSFISNTPSGALRQNDHVTVYGIPVGKASGENKMGGTSEHIVIVGTLFSK